MHIDRQSGLFLHVASLPGPEGIGTLGGPARRFVDFLSRADQSLWQFCPTGPTSTAYGNSPYSAFSAFAGNPLFVDLATLREWGWLDDSSTPAFDPDRVEYGQVTAYKLDRLRRAHEGFHDRATADERARFDAFCRREREWLDDYALFMALKREYGSGWTEWPAPVRDREQAALDAHRERFDDELSFRRFCQFCYDEQWHALRSYAADHGVSLVGDVPIYVAGDSADVWANREVFQLDEAGHPTAVAGVPDAPDEVFDAQRWGMPLFDWETLEKTGFEWWIRRFDRLLDQVDLVRIDHFRGLESYWAIPADEPDPNVGEWRDVPSEAFLDAVAAAVGELPTWAVAEDIGHITDAVDDLRERYDLASLKLLPFVEWCDPDHPHKPHAYPEATVAYTSTHDSDTARGTYESMSDEQRACLHAYFDVSGSTTAEATTAEPGDPGAAPARVAALEGRAAEVDPTVAADINWTFIEAVWASDAVLAFAQLQDVLGLGSDARFNVPGTTEDNWAWRVRESALTDETADRLAQMTARCGR